LRVYGKGKMYLLDAAKFRQSNEWKWIDLVSQVKAGINSHHRCVLIQNFGAGESNELLINLATSLGRPFTQCGLAGHPLEDKMVFRVECCGDGIPDSRDVILYSTTHLGFPSHTDGSGKPNPYDVVLLYCVRQDTAGGESILITLDELLQSLKPESITTLRRKIFPVPYGTAPVISGEASDLRIRYNAEELSFYARLHRFEFKENQRRALADLAAAISVLEVKQPKVRISPGQCLVIDNKRALHGRTPFSQGSNRLLKRIRVYWD